MYIKDTSAIQTVYEVSYDNQTMAFKVTFELSRQPLHPLMVHMAYGSPV
jgi:hypothetical protein